MGVGIERLDLYTPRLCTDAIALAEKRGREREVAVEQIMLDSRSVLPVFEDAVTMAVNAANRLLTPEDRQDIELLIVGTESAVDFGKPISTWVHRYCQLPANCRNFEVKHACYGATAALKMAAFWVASGIRPGKKALVISSDATRPELTSGYDFIGGACAVAMIVSADPRLLEIDLAQAGYWTNEISDTFRPTARDEMGDNETSLFAYLDALEGAYEQFLENGGEIDFDASFAHHIYHAPFPGMTFQAHRTLLGRMHPVDKATAMASFKAKVLPGLGIARQIGSAYGASNFVCLLGLMSSMPPDKLGDRLSLFAYGSGCQGEFYTGSLGLEAHSLVQALAIDGHLSERSAVSTTDYEESEHERATLIELADYNLDLSSRKAYLEQYDGRHLLVLPQVRNFQREYRWS